MTSGLRFVWFVSGALGALAACGGAELSPKAAPASPAEAPSDATGPRSIEEAQAQIAQARDALESGPKEELAGAPKKSEPEPAAPPPSPQGGASRAREPEAPKATSSCATPCRALASMKRAVDSLCRMTGDADERCVDARRTLAKSTTRVAACKCEETG